MGASRSCITSCCTTGEDADEAGVSGFVESLSVLDWGPGTEPVGQVFEETLAQLGPLDRQLLLFCATPSLVAVRWLLHLGACLDSADANGSTCLHVACRAGTVAVATEVMRHDLLLDAADIASWTPLHIAAHMGRREVAVRLLQAKAHATCRNARGQMPIDLCRDPITLKVLLAAAEQPYLADVPSEAAVLGLDGAQEDTMGIPSRCEPECFFVNPAPVFKATAQHRKQVLHIAFVIFNLRPSFGLAFAVASGLVDSYTGAMRLFLQRGRACRVALGNFLGEAFSLCTLIRFSVFDSLPLLHTGVLSSLLRAFSVLQLPEDLMKIERLVRGLSHVWWRKHKALAEGLTENPTPAQQQQLALQQQRYQAISLYGPTDTAESRELSGMELWQYLSGSDALCQMLLSTVLLHWYVHGNGSGRGRPMALETWLALNRGIEVGGGDVPEHLQQRLHGLVCRSHRPQLVLASVPAPAKSPRQDRSAPEASLWGSPAASPGRAAASAAAPAAAAALVPGGVDLELDAEAHRALSAEAIADAAVEFLLAAAAAAKPPSSDAAPGASPAASSANPQAPEATPRLKTTAASPLPASAFLLSGGLSGSTAASLAMLPEPLIFNLGLPPLHECASAEGWVQLMGGVLLAPSDVLFEAGQGCCERPSVAGVPSKLPSSITGRSPQSSPRRPATCWPDGSSEGVVWASLCSVFLLFAASNGHDGAGAPYVMCDARQLRIKGASPITLVLSLEAIPGNSGRGEPQMHFCRLLPDGRWQEVRLPRLELRLRSAEDLELWVANLVQRTANHLADPPIVNQTI